MALCLQPHLHLYFQTLKSELEKLYPLVESYNEKSLAILAVLPQSALTTRISMLLEVKVFDVSLMWYSANIQVCPHLCTCMYIKAGRYTDISIYHGIQIIPI